jgi:hypothetical protein
LGNNLPLSRSDWINNSYNDQCQICHGSKWSAADACCIIWTNSGDRQYFDFNTVAICDLHSYPHAYKHFNINGDSNCNEYFASTNRNTYVTTANSHEYTDGNANSNADRHPNPYADEYSYFNADSYHVRHFDADGHTNSNTYAIVNNYIHHNAYATAAKCHINGYTYPTIVNDYTNSNAYSAATDGDSHTNVDA